MRPFSIPPTGPMKPDGIAPVKVAGLGGAGSGPLAYLDGGKRDIWQNVGPGGESPPIKKTP